MRYGLHIALALLVGCSSAPLAIQVPPGSRLAAVDCGGVISMPHNILEHTTVVFGEIHGTREIPHFVGDYLCMLLANGKKVTVGIEVPSSEQAGIDAFLSAPIGQVGYGSLLSSPFWRAAANLGQTTTSVLELLDRIRGYRQQGLPVEVFAFDAAGAQKVTDPRSIARNRDKAMAANIKREIDKEKGRYVLALVGDVHASKREFFPWDPDYRTMGNILSKEVPFLSLRANYRSGTHRDCTPKCAISQLKPKQVVPGEVWSIVYADAKESIAWGGYDGWFNVGEVSASASVLAE